MPEAPIFTIRGHHLNHYSGLIRMVEHYQAANSEDPFRHAAGDIATSTLISNLASWDPYFSEDILGSSDDSRNNYRESLTELFHQFLLLPDDTEIQLLSDFPDHMCGLCVIGKHCTEISSKETDDAHIEAALAPKSDIKLSAGELKKILKSPEYYQFLLQRARDNDPV